MYEPRRGVIIYYKLYSNFHYSCRTVETVAEGDERGMRQDGEEVMEEEVKQAEEKMERVYLKH